MRYVVALLALSLAGPSAHAQPAAPAEPGAADAHLALARAAFGTHDLATALVELQAAYASEARPDLLFAIGQVELNLGHYAEAVDYYRRYLATNPSPEKATLAQQAIGAARIRLLEPQVAPRPATPPPERPPPRLRYGHRWERADTTLALIGLAAAVTAPVLVAYGRSLDHDAPGLSLSQYSRREDRSRTLQWAGVVVAGLGLSGLVGALVHWRVQVDVLGVEPVATEHPTGLAVSASW